MDDFDLNAELDALVAQDELVRALERLAARVQASTIAIVTATLAGAVLIAVVLVILDRLG